MSTRPPLDVQLLFWFEGGFFKEGTFVHGKSPELDRADIRCHDLSYIRQNGFVSGALKITHWMPAPDKP